MSRLQNNGAAITLVSIFTLMSAGFSLHEWSELTSETARQEAWEEGLRSGIAEQFRASGGGEDQFFEILSQMDSNGPHGQSLGALSLPVTIDPAPVLESASAALRRHEFDYTVTFGIGALGTAFLAYSALAMAFPHKEHGLRKRRPLTIPAAAGGQEGPGPV